MVDPGELVSKTLMREFMEEAMASEDIPEEKRGDVTKSLEKFFNRSKSNVNTSSFFVWNLTIQTEHFLRVYLVKQPVFKL
jgi:hypothetical protein